jgi:hypothetical protein
MVGRVAGSEDRSMFPDAFIPLGQVPATAARLDRAAAELRQRAGAPHAVPRLPITLSHLEDAFDQLAASMRLLAEVAAEWCATNDADERTLPPDARALLWHLRSVADTLTEARDGCLTTRPWAHKLLEQVAPEPESGVIVNLPTAHHPPARRIICGADGSGQARHAASVASPRRS